MSEAPSAALPSGCRIAEYEIVRVLGAGGFGITYLAFDHQLDGPVALKEYFPADVATRVGGATVEATSSAGRETFAWGFDRFMAEARAIHRFRHPNVVRAHRYLEANGTAYIVMEYVEGESLKAILDRKSRLPAEEWRPWLDALLDGLAHVHGHDYLHRDIKPANIVVRAEDGEPVLIDFGAARVQHRDRTHTQVLTAGYAPIEQYSTGVVQGPPTDIYALAAVSYRVLTGDVVPSAPDRVLSDDYETLTERVAAAAPEWLTAIDHGLAVRPENRPPNVRTWRRRLTSATSTETADGDPPQPNVTERTAADHAAARRQSARKKPARRRLPRWLRHWWPTVAAFAFYISLGIWSLYCDSATPTFEIVEGPSFATIHARAGFRPDTITHWVLGGVSSDAPHIERDCVGYTEKAPDIRIQWTGTTDTLYIGFVTTLQGWDDATLLVNLPDGSLLCNDNDDSGLGPLVRESRPYYPPPAVQGLSRVWWILKNRFSPEPKPHPRPYDPLVRVDAPQEGQYNIWVGTPSPTLLSGTLTISESANPELVTERAGD